MINKLMALYENIIVNKIWYVIVINIIKTLIK